MGQKIATMGKGDQFLKGKILVPGAIRGIKHAKTKI
jgi:hypothetical protein